MSDKIEFINCYRPVGFGNNANRYTQNILYTRSSAIADRSRDVFAQYATTFSFPVTVFNSTKF